MINLQGLSEWLFLYEEKPPPPRSTSREAFRRCVAGIRVLLIQHIIFGEHIFFCICFMAHVFFPPGGSTVVGYVIMIYTCYFLCTDDVGQWHTPCLSMHWENSRQWFKIIAQFCYLWCLYCGELQWRWCSMNFPFLNGLTIQQLQSTRTSTTSTPIQVWSISRNATTKIWY